MIILRDKQANEAKLLTKAGFTAIGLKWEGTFVGAAAGEIRNLQRELRRRVHEIVDALEPDRFFGLSYHANPASNGFIHYAVVEVTDVEKIPSGMEIVTLPELTYATCDHEKGQAIDRSYQNIYEWIQSQGYEENPVGHLTHVELYKMDKIEEEPEFTILIPVKKS